MQIKEKAKKFISSKWGKLIILITIILVGFRIALPYIVKDYVNKTLSEIPGYKGEVGDITMNLWRGAYEIIDVSLVKKDGKVPVPFFSAKKIDLSVQWGAIFHGSLVGEIYLRNPKLNFVEGPTKQQSQNNISGSWTDKVKKLFPLRINKFQIDSGEIHFRNYYSDPKVDIFLNNISALAENLTNSKDISDSLMATLKAHGNVMGQGTFLLNAKIDPFQKAPTFKFAMSLKNIDLTKLNNFIMAYGKFDVEQGTFQLYGEFAAANGKFEGYVKPIIRNMEVLSLKKDIKNPLKLFWEAIVGAVTGVFKNQSENQLAAKIPFSGSFKDPSANIWDTVGSILKNAFIKALVPGIEGSVSIKQLQK
jgi:Domain of Unknown Function (DUF748)